MSGASNSYIHADEAKAAWERVKSELTQSNTRFGEMFLSVAETAFLRGFKEARQSDGPNYEAVAILRKIDDSGVLFRHNMDLDADVANFLHRLDATGERQGEKA